MLLDISILPQTCEELFYFIKEKSLILCGLWRFANAYIATLKERSFQLLKIKGYLRKNDEGKYL